METNENIISSEAKLSAVAAVMFFAPFVKSRVKSNPDFTEEERQFIAWYLQIWYVNLVFLFIILVAWGLEFFRINWISSWIITIWSFAIYIISIFSIFACVNDLSMRNKDESIMQKIQHKGQLIKAYTPILNFVLRFRQENYDMPYRRLKESILLRTFFIFWTLFLWNSFWMWILIIIAVRIILLLLNIDIIPISMKKAINSKFSCNPWEIFAYFFAPMISKLKKSDCETVLQEMKLWYAKWQSIWIWIIIQYILFIGLLYVLYTQYYKIDISVYNIILFVAMIMRIVRVVLFCVYKKTLLKIPILSEIVSLIFH